MATGISQEQEGDYSRGTKRQKESPLCYIDICHLKNAELKPQLQKYEGRVVLRGDIVKDDSGAYAVFTEQGSSASQTTAAKVMDVVARLPDCDGEADDAVPAYTQVKLEDAPKLRKIPKSVCLDVWKRLPRHTWPKSWANIEDPVVPLERKNRHPLAGLLWERHFELVLLELGWENVPNEECLFVHRKHGLFLSVYVDHIKIAGKKQNMAFMWKKEMKNVDPDEPNSFLDHVHLECTQRECKPSEIISEEKTKMFESSISAGATEQLPVWEKPQAKTVAWSYDMEEHDRKCVEQQESGATVQSFKSLLG